MTNLEIIILAVALALDSMLVSFSYGLVFSKKRLYNSLLLAVAFGFFQFLMPVIGGFFTGFLYSQLEIYSKWIVFVIFLILGCKFLKSAFEEKNEAKECCINFSCLIFLSIATSIDALGAGVSIKLLNINTLLPALLIGVITFVLSFFGFWIASCFRKIPSKLIEILGALLLIYLAFKAIL